MPTMVLRIGLALNILIWLGVVAAFCCLRMGPHSRQGHRNGNGEETGHKG